MAFLIHGPLSAGESLDLGFALARRHFAALLGLAAVPLGLAVASDAALRLAGAGENAEMLSLLPVLALMGVAEARMIAAAWELLHGREIQPALVRRRVREQLASVLIGYTMKWLLILTGIILLVLPAIWVLLVLFAVPTVTVLEGRGWWSSFQRSRRLARGQKRRLLATLGLFDITASAFAVGLSVVFADSGTGRLPLWADALNWAVSVLLLPVRAALAAVVFGEMKVRLEGYDLEVAAEHLPGAA